MRHLCIWQYTTESDDAKEPVGIGETDRPGVGDWERASGRVGTEVQRGCPGCSPSELNDLGVRNQERLVRKLEAWTGIE